MKEKYPYVFFVCKDLSIDDVGVLRDTVFQKTRPGGVGFKTGDFVKEKLGGLTVERFQLVYLFCGVVTSIYINGGLILR